VSEIIEDEGPFDGVIGFSQGASLALSILYHHEINHPNQPPPFRFAVFFCAVLSISPDHQFNANVISKYSRYYKSLVEGDDSNGSQEEKEDEGNSVTEFSVQGKSSSKFKVSVPNHRGMLLLPGQKKALANDIIGLVRQLAESGVDHDDTGMKQWITRGGEEGFPRVYHPLVNKQRISIPTVHAIGRSDPLRRHGALQARLCNKNLTRVIEFHGNHKVPRNVNDLQEVAFAVEWAIRMAQLG
jgi:hypothetical protein